MPSMLYVIQKICSSSAASINTPKTHTSIIRSEASSSSIKKGMLRKLRIEKKEFGRKIRRFSCFKNNTTKKVFF